MMETIKWLLSLLTALVIANGLVWLLVGSRFGDSDVRRTNYGITTRQGAKL